MMIQPLVSVALCTYNGEKFLTEQLDSLIGQTYQNLEIVVTDDCSSDETIAILKSYAEQHPNFKIYQNEENLGYVKNFEKAITLCRGEFIALCDQDDIWDLNKIAIQVETIGDNLLGYHDSEFINQNGVSLNKKMSDLLRMYEGDSYRPFLFFNSVSGHASLISKRLVSYALPFPKGLFHDRWLAFVATNLGSIKYIDQPLVKYRQHENSDTNILKLKRKESKKELHGNPKIKKALAELEVLMTFKFNKEPAFIQQLYNLYKGRLDSYFCPRLVFFMYAHFQSLLYISKKNTLSKFNFVFKHFWGSKLKSE